MAEIGAGPSGAERAEAELPGSPSARNTRPASTGPASTGDLFERFSASRDPALRAELFEAHRDLATYLARRFANRGRSLQDLTSVAERALSSAVDRFDPAGETDFTWFATTTVVAELKAYMTQGGWAMGTPRRTDQLYRELSDAVGPLALRLGRSPTIANLARAVDASEEEVLEALEAGQSYRFASVGDADPRGRSDPEAVVGAHPGTETLGARDQPDEEAILRHLPRREREVTRLRIFEGMSQPEISEALSISQSEVSRLLARSVAQLRSVPDSGPGEGSGSPGRGTTGGKGAGG